MTICAEQTNVPERPPLTNQGAPAHDDQESFHAARVDLLRGRRWL